MSPKILTASMAGLALVSLAACGAEDVGTDPGTTLAGSADLARAPQAVHDFWTSVLSGNAPDFGAPGCVVGQSGALPILAGGLAISGTGSYRQASGIVNLSCSMAQAPGYVLPVLTASDDDSGVKFGQRPSALRMVQYVNGVMAHGKNLQVVVDGRVMAVGAPMGLAAFVAGSGASTVRGLANGIFLTLPSLPRGHHEIEVKAEMDGAQRIDSRMMLEIH